MPFEKCRRLFYICISLLADADNRGACGEKYLRNNGAEGGKKQSVACLWSTGSSLAFYLLDVQSSNLNRMNRDQLLERLERERSWDFVVIGGGATGLGIAVDAASRGFRVALLEQADFTKSTSSKSTKLVHGGVRYLAQGDVRLVLEALKERGLMRRNAPHLVRDQSFVIPCYRWWEAPFYGIGLTLYDLMAGRLSFGRSRYLSRKRALEAVPALSADKLRGGILYHDGQFDDSRMAVNLAQTAVEHGAVAVNYVRVEKLLKTDGRLSGVEA